MEHAMVLIDGEGDPAAIVREAAELANGVDSDLTLLYVTTEEEYENKRRALADYLERGDTHYTVDESVKGAGNFVRDLASETIDDLGIKYNTEARFGDPEEEVIKYARDHGIDHIFLRGRRRSPVGKAVFGDVAQQIILNFDGATTIFLRE